MAQSDYLLIVKTMKRMDAIEAKFDELEKRMAELENKPLMPLGPLAQNTPSKKDTKAA